MNSRGLRVPIVLCMLALLLNLAPSPATAADVTNPACPVEIVKFNPANGEDIIVPQGFKISVFKAGLNFPTSIAFRGNKTRFEIYVLESGHGLPSRCNDETLPVYGGLFSPTNPMTPDILVFAAETPRPLHVGSSGEFDVCTRVPGVSLWDEGRESWRTWPAARQARCAEELGAFIAELQAAVTVEQARALGCAAPSRSTWKARCTATRR